MSGKNPSSRGHEVVSENNSRSSSTYGAGRKFPQQLGLLGPNSRRGRNFSGDSSDLYPFHLDGPPSYGEVVAEPTFVTPVMGGVTYVYDGQLFTPGAATGLGSEEALKNNIKTQIEYYFSRENLMKDFFLRRKMEEDGSLPVTFVASFNRVRSLTSDVTFIIQAVQDSEIVEVKDGKVCYVNVMYNKIQY